MRAALAGAGRGERRQVRGKGRGRGRRPDAQRRSGLGSPGQGPARTKCPRRGDESSPRRATPRPRVARPAWSTGQIALQGAQIRHTLEFLLSRNQLISPLFKSIRDTHKRQSAASQRLPPVWLSARQSLICILIRGNSPSALEWRVSDLESRVYLAHVPSNVLHQAAGGVLSVPVSTPLPPA